MPYDIQIFKVVDADEKIIDMFTEETCCTRFREDLFDFPAVIHRATADEWIVFVGDDEELW